MRLRPLVAKQLRYLIGQRVDHDTVVSRGIPREGVQVGKLVAVHDITGVETSVPTMRAGRQATHDVFEIDVLCIAWTPGASDFDDADDAAAALADLVREAVVADTDLGFTDSSGCVVSAVLSTVDGPNPWRTDVGAGSAVRCVVTVTTRD